MSSTSSNRLLSRDHFSVDGTLIDAWASMKSFRSHDDAGDDDPWGGRNAERNFRGDKRSNKTHSSSTDGDKESRLCFMGHALMENRNGLVIDGRLTRATGTAERDATLYMLGAMDRGQRRITLGGDKGYDVQEFVQYLRQQKVTPHMARNDYITKGGKCRKSAVDRRTTRHPGYGISQRIRKRIEEIFGWIKSAAALRQTKFRGQKRVSSQFTLFLAAYNLIRLPKLLGDSP